MTPEDIRLLYDYNSWANRRTLDSCADLSEEQFTRDLGSSFPSVRDTLAHIMGGEWIWYERFQGRTPSALPKAEEFPSLASLRSHWTGVESNLHQYVSRLSTDDLARVLEFKTLTAGTVASPLWQALQHVVNHSSYHRGQIATMLRQLGATPVSTDLTRFYRERAAAKSA